MRASRNISKEHPSPNCNMKSRKLRSTRVSTYFLAWALEQCLNKNQLSQQLLAERTLLDPSKISRTLAGKTKCSPDDLATLIQAFPNPQDKADLILAHISDSIPSSAFNYVSVGRKMDEAPLSTSEKVKGVSEVPEPIRALEFLRKQQELVPSFTSLLVELARRLKHLPPEVC